MKKLVIGLALAAIVYQVATRGDLLRGHATPAPITAEPAVVSDDSLARAYAQHLRDVQVEGRGTIEKVLKDDNDGSRHQRMIVRLASGQTVLIAHNIDLAPRVGAPREGDEIAFSGEYVWNEKGGVIHWTHRDPSGHHVAGWIRHDGRQYQ